MAKPYTPKPGDIVTIPGNDTQWMILAPAPTIDDRLKCNCYREYTDSAHSSTCTRRVRRLGHYWLQCNATGALYRPNGDDVAVHKSELTLISAHSLPTKRELLAAELF